MTTAHKAFLAEYYWRASSVFEFGVGESSTLLAAAAGVRRFTGVESDATWIARLGARVPSHFRLVWADIGQTGDFGYPQDAASGVKWPFYSIGALAAERDPFSLYLIDGRFRIACALAALLHGGYGALVMVHDFSVTEGVQDRLYGVVLDAVAERVDGCGTEFGVLRRRTGVTDEEIRRLWDKWKYDTM